MSGLDADRNLLFGVLALQLELIDTRQFVDVCTGWAAHKTRSMAELLIERGWITPADQAEVERLLKRKLARFDNDPQASLASVADDRARQALAEVDDVDVKHTLDHLRGPEKNVLVSTISYAPQSRDRYTLTRLHAKGGLGQVWLARDTDLGREIALKELRPDRVASPDVWARFVQEARVTGQLEHPNIVPVHELVRPSDPEQPPFYTMRFVNGQTFSEAIRAYHAQSAPQGARTLEFQALLTSFVGVCNAVAYAHSRGVIHRDLKGQNVVLGDYGEVIVLDWGLAKLVGRPDETITPQVTVSHEEGRAETLAGQVLGTPAYMSPEQAEGRWAHIDHRSDVYGLGAMLYELLTGTAPFDGSDTVDLLRRVVGEAPRAPRVISPSAPAALESVCLKALCKRPEDRYPSALALADEIRHFLADEPVSAFREPAVLRLGRWARCHRPLVASGAVLLVTAVVGLSIGAWLLRQANARTERQRLAAVKHMNDANRNFAIAREAVDRYFTKVSENRLLKEPRMDSLRKELLEEARQFYQKMTEERADDPALRGNLADSYVRLGYIHLAMGQPNQAEAQIRRGVSILEALVKANPRGSEYRASLANALSALGDALFQRAEPNLAEAEGGYRKAIQIARDLAGERPEQHQRQYELSQRLAALYSFYHDSLREPLCEPLLKEAVQASEEAVAAVPDRTEYLTQLAMVQNNLGVSYASSGRVRAALPLFQAASELREKILVLEGADRSRDNDLGLYQFNLGRFATVSGDLDSAARALQQAVSIWQRIGEDHPDLPGTQSALAHALLELGFVDRQRGRRAEAKGRFRRSVALLEPLVRDAPETFFFRREVLASALIALGDLAKDDGNSREAEQAFRGALEQLAIVQRARPHETATADRVQTTHAKIADVYRHAGRLAESRVEAGKAIAIAEGIVRDHPDWPNARSRLARYHYALGINVKALGDFDAAEKSLTRAEALLEALVREQPDVVSHQRLLHDVRFVQATVALAVGRIDRALAFADTLAARGEGGDFYNAACFYALASGVCERTCPARVEPFAARSVDLLRHSHSRGFLTVSSNIKHLMTDSDLAALRARADFRALVEALIFRHDPFAR